ncbi:MAG: SMC family ATPase [Chloroflexi bacterium]|nr:SMC family ATPase [Chloroflexota bacterium]
MVPLRLALRNFLCYRGPTSLDLAGLRLACLCGDNGNGKSALLDAMTWALWGKARGPDDDLIHMAESEMEVDLEFLAGGQRYRAVRRRARPHRPGGAGQTALELFQATADGWLPLTGDGVRQTEARVSQLVGLDYGTFINSAFLVQGRADEFTVKPPNQRKQVLADILGLGYYDQAAARARESAREREGQRQAQEAALTRIETDLGRLPQYQGEVEAQEAQLAKGASGLAESQANLQQLEAGVHRLEALQAQLQGTIKARQQAAERLAHWQGELARRQQALQEHQALLAQTVSIQEGYARWQEAAAREEAHARKLGQALALRGERMRLEQAIAAERQRLEGQRRELEAKMALWRPVAQALLGYERQRDEATARVKDLAQAEAALEHQARELDAAREQESRLVGTLRQLASEVQALKEKTHLLGSRLVGTPRCPLCGSELGAEQRERLRAESAAQGEDKAREMQGVEQDQLRQRRQVQTLQEQAARERQRLGKERAALEGRLQALEGDISRGRQASNWMAQASQQVQSLQDRLSSGDFLKEEQAHLKEVLAQEAHLAYDPAQHQAAREERDRLKHYQELYQRLGEVQASLEAERQATETAQLEVTQWQAACREAEQRQAALEAGLVELPHVAREAAEARRQVETLAQQQARLQAELGAAWQRLDACLALRGERDQRLAALARATEDKSLYEELAEAFGKRGIQALIIETVLPELEAEANRLLARMSDNRLRVALETQRQARSRKGDAIETLDINISDELGTRPYEMYSGGEAFRIDFALRIALSKLLARRAGAPLPTLFIDEGFGTQDAEGREKLVEAIRSIQDDFDLILVITHMEDMKDAFPVRIEVAKTEAGSTISMS